MGPSLIGPKHHLSGYGTADVLFDYTQQVMPADRPGRMLAVEYWAVLAYILDENGLLLPGTPFRRRDRPAGRARSMSVDLRTRRTRGAPPGSRRQRLPGGAAPSVRYLTTGGPEHRGLVTAEGLPVCARDSDTDGRSRLAWL
jgi:hypothetical protein